MRDKVGTAMLAAVIAVITAVVASVATLSLAPQKAESDYIRDFYLTENAVHVSPHSLRGKIDKGVSDFVLVDLRSAEEYEREHIVGAVSIPAYSDRNTAAYGEVDRIVSAFAALPKGKDLIVYCYSTPCMTGRKIGGMLAGHGIYVKHLGIGWNEWRHFWQLWNHEHEWNTTFVNDYVISGKEPGVFQKVNISALACPIEGDFGC